MTESPAVGHFLRVPAHFVIHEAVHASFLGGLGRLHARLQGLKTRIDEHLGGLSQWADLGLGPVCQLQCAIASLQIWPFVCRQALRQLACLRLKCPHVNRSLAALCLFNGELQKTRVITEGAAGRLLGLNANFSGSCYKGEQHGEERHLHTHVHQVSVA